MIIYLFLSFTLVYTYIYVSVALLGDDATDMFCRWCANGGNLYCCSYCSNTFCYKCIGRNFTSSVRKRIEEDEKWKCFACNPTDLYSARAICWALLQHVQIVTRQDCVVLINISLFVILDDIMEICRINVNIKYNNKFLFNIF